MSSIWRPIRNAPRLRKMLIQDEGIVVTSVPFHRPARDATDSGCYGPGMTDIDGPGADSNGTI